MSRRGAAAFLISRDVIPVRDSPGPGDEILAARPRSPPCRPDQGTVEMDGSFTWSFEREGISSDRLSNSTSA